MNAEKTLIGDLALLGDRRTAAVLDSAGNILWYCPRRFDQPSVFGALLDPRAGIWSLQLEGAVPGGRRYLEESGVLETRLRSADGDLYVTDWLNGGSAIPRGVLCRRFSPAPAELTIQIAPRPDYGRQPAGLRAEGPAVVLGGSDQYLYASHRLVVDGDRVLLKVPKGQTAWAVLADCQLGRPEAADLQRWLDATLEYWHELSASDQYTGPYARQVLDSMRAIRLLTHEDSGGIVAAATASLPEVPGGAANWDYRYVWLRDAGMIVSALTRLDGDVTQAEGYLDFICASRGSSSRYPVAVFTALDGRRAPAEEFLDMAGYAGSRPVRIGNDARDQLQLDAYANVVLAAKLVYGRSQERPHWDAAEEFSDFLVEHWQEPDHGIWEETPKRQYTASKVIAAMALQFIADFSENRAQAKRWRAAARDIRAYVERHCLTSKGAYAVYAGSEDVDVSAALFPAWAYTKADAPAMRATIATLQTQAAADGLLYRRHLECTDARREGVFLAGTFWVAQYWVARGDLQRARRILDAGLQYANPLGLFAEEADPETGALLGNFPQSFVHASFIGAVIDLRNAEGRTVSNRNQQRARTPVLEGQ